ADGVVGVTGRAILAIAGAGDGLLHQPVEHVVGEGLAAPAQLGRRQDLAGRAANVAETVYGAAAAGGRDGGHAPDDIAGDGGIHAIAGGQPDPLLGGVVGIGGGAAAHAVVGDRAQPVHDVPRVAGVDTAGRARLHARYVTGGIPAVIERAVRRDLG